MSAMNKTISTFMQGFLAVVLAGGLVFLTACAGGGSSSSKEEQPNANIRLVRLDQYKKLHKNVSNGGQYLIATVAINNISKEDQKFRPHEFVIRKVPTEANPQPFEQKVEQNVNLHYQLQFGQEAMTRLFDKEEVVHPGFTIKKELVYQVPEDASLDEYEIRYIPYDETYPFSDSEVEILDHREGTQATEPGRNAH